MPDRDVAAGASFDELLEHFDDLIAFAHNEGYARFAARLLLERSLFDERRADYSQRTESLPAQIATPSRRST